MLIHNADITGSLLVNGTRFNTGSFSGSFIAGTNVLSGDTVSLTGSLLGTASFASNAQQSVSSSFASTASFALNSVNNNTGSFTGSFIGDGSQLTGVTSSIQPISTVSDTFTSVTSYTVTHNFNTKEVIVSVYENDTLIFPSSINTPTVNTVTITFPEPVTGRVVVVKAGHIVSGSIDYSNVLNKPTLVSGSSQVTYSGLTGIPSGIVSGSAQVVYSGLTGIPSGIVSSSAQVAGFGIFATTGSNQFNGNQAITGSLTTTGTIVAQTLNVQQVTSSIVYSSGSNIFGNSVSNTQQFTGSLQVSGSSHSILGNVGVGIAIPTNPLHIQSNTLSQLNVTALSGNTNAQINLEPTGTGIALIGPANNVDLAFRTNATTRMLISGSGDVGIGRTPSSGFKLDIQGNGGLRILDNDVLRSIIITPPNSGATGIISTASGQGLSFQATNVAGNLTFETAGVERMRITSGGNVGIGTDSPAGILTAAQSNANSITTVTVDNIASFPASAGTQGTILRFRSRIDDTAIRTTGAIASYAMKSTGAGANNNGDLRFYTGQEGDTNERMRITSGGNIEIGTTGFSSPSGADRFIGVYGAQDSSLILQDAVQLWELYVNDDFYINRGSTNVLTALRSNGNVGIGTTSPGANLHVVRAGDGGSGTPGVILSTANGANDIVRFQDGTTTVAVVKNDGSIGIGTPTPTNKLHLTGASSTPSLRLGSTSVGFHWDIGRENQSTGDFVFNSTNVSTGTTEKMRITQDSVAYLRMASGTGGIQFNGDTAAANALDDYEEGTWTPVPTSTGATFNTTVNGTYTKIGRLVFITGQLDNASSPTGTLTNEMSITGLPFTSSPGMGYGASLAIGFEVYIDYPAGGLNIQARIVSNTTSISLRFTKDDASGDDFLASNFDFSDARIAFAGCYEV